MSLLCVSQTKAFSSLEILYKALSLRDNNSPFIAKAIMTMSGLCRHIKIVGPLLREFQQMEQGEVFFRRILDSNDRIFPDNKQQEIYSINLLC